MSSSYINSNSVNSNSINSNSVNSDSTAQFPWKLVLFILFLFVPCIVTVLSPHRIITFDTFEFDKFLQLLIYLFLIALFIEQALEVIVNILRDTKKDELKNEKELELYKNETKQMTLLLGLSFGLIISALGIRVLGTITPVNYNNWDVHIFNLLDILLTGSVIAGGSEGIHKIIRNFIGFFQKDIIPLKNNGRLGGTK